MCLSLEHIVLMISIVFLSFFVILSDKILFLMCFIMIYASFVSTMLLLKAMPWFGLLFFLVYVSGLLVLFGYTIAMSPNNLTPPISKKYVTLGVVIPLLPQFNKIDIEFNSTDYKWDIVGILTYANLTMYLMMTILLLMSLLAVVNITYKAPSPLRPYL